MFLKSYFNFLIGGQLRVGNIEMMNYVIEKLPNKSKILQIGVFTGKTSIILDYLSKKIDKEITFYDCDHYEFTKFEKKWFEGNVKSITSKDYDNFIYLNYINNKKFFKLQNT